MHRLVTCNVVIAEALQQRGVALRDDSPLFAMRPQYSSHNSDTSVCQSIQSVIIYIYDTNYYIDETKTEEWRHSSNNPLLDTQRHH